MCRVVYCMAELSQDELKNEISRLEARIKELKESLGNIPGHELKASVNREIHMLEKRQKDAQNILERNQT